MMTEKDKLWKNFVFNISLNEYVRKEVNRERKSLLIALKNMHKMNILNNK